jgi:citronellol/citronellal dehydrogenase
MIARMPDGARSEVFAPGLLHDRVALVTGGGTGLGKATAIELARCGARVVIAGRRAEVLREAVAEIRAAVGHAAAEDTAVGRAAAGHALVGHAAVGVDENGEGRTGAAAGTNVDTGVGTVDWVAGDVREPADAERLVATVLERHDGRLDALVNNAGGQYYTPAEGIVAKGWRAVWRLNVEGMLNMSEAAVEQGMGGVGVAVTPPPEGTAGRAGEGTVVRAGEGRAGEGMAGRACGGAAGEEPAGGTIVNVTLSPHHGMPGMAHSGAARATVEALTREMAERWAGRKIAVTAVAAGHFDTEAMGKYPDAVRAGMARSVPMQRLGRPEEHAWLVTLLCSPMGRALNGSTVTLDGARDNWFGPWPPLGLTGETGEVPTEERRRPVSDP